MKYRYLSVFLLVLILAIGAVSAQDNATDSDVVSLDSNVDIIQDEESSTPEDVHINDTNYADYFDENGTMNSNISADSNLYIGDITNKTFFIDKTVFIMPDNNSSKIVDSTFTFIKGSDKSTISGLNFNNEQVAAICIMDASDITISENEIYIMAWINEADIAVIAINAKNLNISSNYIEYNGISDGYAYTNAMNIEECENAVIEDNQLLIKIPSCPVGWSEVPPGSGNWVSSPVSEGVVISSSNNLLFNRNSVTIIPNNKIGDYDTIYAVRVVDCDNATLDSNMIGALGYSYIYGLLISGENFNISNNVIDSSSYEYYANCIDIEGPASGVIENNELLAVSPVVAYPVYSAMSNGNVSVSYANNQIISKAHIVYGMELAGAVEAVVNNTIFVYGNYTTAIASESASLFVIGNNITTYGDNLGDIPTGDSFAAGTVAINLHYSNAVVIGNNIESTSTGILVNGENTIIYNNTISVNDSGLMDSYAILSDGAEDLRILNNDIYYVGNTNGTNENFVIKSSNSKTTIVNNTISGEIVSADVIWQEIPPGSLNWVAVVVSSGIEIENATDLIFVQNDVEISYNNVLGFYDTIYTVHVVDSDNAVIDSNTITADGFSYIYGLVLSGENFTVSNNEIVTTSDYYANGIDIEGYAEGTVANNNISASAPNFAYPVYSAMSNGDVSVVYDGNNIMGNADTVYAMDLSGESEVVTNNVIDANGNLTTGITARFENITISGNVINVNGDNLGDVTTEDVFAPNTIAINLFNANAYVSDNVIQSTATGIMVNGGNITVDNNTFNVADNGLINSYGILASDVEDLEILNNDIYYEGNTNGTNENFVIKSSNSKTAIVNNTISGDVVSADLIWQELPPGSWNWVAVVVSGGIEIENATDLLFEQNDVEISYNDVVGFYDTIYAVHIVDSDNAVINENIITADGFSYIYGLVLSGENFTVSDNYISSVSDAYYANGIDIEGSASGSVENNSILAYAPTVSYPVYSSMSNGDVVAEYTANTIIGEADIVYGMELAGDEENVVANDITVEGNYTTGIAAKSKNITIFGNNIYANGKNLGNTTTGDSFAPETTGIKILSGNALIEQNNIRSTAPFCINLTYTNGTATYNYLISNESFGDACVDHWENATVHDNLPDYDAFLETSDLVLFYKNGTHFVAKLVGFYGDPIANATISFYLNGREYNRTTNENGTASMAINLPEGEYSIVTTFNPGSSYTPTEVENTIVVLTTVWGDDLVKMYRNASQYYATFLDGQGNPLTNGTAVFNINGVMYERKINENGTAKLNINLAQGTYIITATNPVNGEMHANNITVLSTIANNTDLVKYYRNASQYVVTVLGADGNPVGAGENVTFNINGVMYTRTTNESGQAKLNINLGPGNYTVTAEYNGCKVSNNIEVLPVLSANDLVMKQGTSDQFIAFLVDGQGNPYAGQNITFNIHGVFYTRTTDVDGRAALNIRLTAAADTYIITSSYNGTSISNTIKIEP